MLRGLLWAGAAALLSGSFTVGPKWASQQATARQAAIPRPVTAWWLSVGCLAASVLLAPWVRQVMSWWGLLSGLLWAFAVVGRVACLEACGMCVGNATPDVATIVTAWVYDALYKHAHFSCRALGGVGLLLLALCLGSIYVLQQQGHVRQQLLARLAVLTHADAERAPAAAPPAAAPPSQGSELECPLLLPHMLIDEDGAMWREMLWGMLLGLVSGVCAGLSQLPYTLAPSGDGGLHFLLSSSIGMLVFSSVNVVLHRVVWHRAGLSEAVGGVDLHAAAAAPWGVAGGVVLLAGTAAGIVAAGDEGMSFLAAKVVAQSSLLVSGAWGVLLFHELRSLLQVLFWLLSLQTLCSYAVIIAARVVEC